MQINELLTVILDTFVVCAHCVKFIGSNESYAFCECNVLLEVSAKWSEKQQWSTWGLLNKCRINWQCKQISNGGAHYAQNK